MSAVGTVTHSVALEVGAEKPGALIASGTWGREHKSCTEQEDTSWGIGVP